MSFLIATACVSWGFPMNWDPLCNEKPLAKLNVLVTCAAIHVTFRAILVIQRDGKTAETAGCEMPKG